MLETVWSEIAWMSSPMVAASAMTMAVVGGPSPGFDVFAFLPVVLAANACATIVLLAAAIVFIGRRLARERTASRTRRLVDLCQLSVVSC